MNEPLTTEPMLASIDIKEWLELKADNERLRNTLLSLPCKCVLERGKRQWCVRCIGLYPEHSK